MKDLELRYQSSADIDEKTISARVTELTPYIQHLKDVASRNDYADDEASIQLPFDLGLEKSVKSLISDIEAHSLKYIIVVGIGGSNLGTRALYDAYRGKLGAYTDDWPKIIFLDTNSPVSIRELLSILQLEISQPKEIVINVISKSGSTAETIANFEVLYHHLSKRFSRKIEKQIVVTTDEGSQLEEAAQAKGFRQLSIPQKVGGRYSVFSAVGLFPLGLAGCNIHEIRMGAAHMRDKCLEEPPQTNPALASAILLFEAQKKGFIAHNNFFFNSSLESVGKWYRQLMGESIGKERDAEGNIVHAGILPTVSVGSTDLHSMAQLYLGGPRNVFTTFVWARDYGKGIKVPREGVFSGLVNGIAGKDFVEIMAAIYGGVTKAYTNAHIPFMEILLPDISEATLGQFLQMKMMEMMYLAKLLDVNAFDQPSVENYKKETRRLLETGF